jgi:hypothetical protein
MVRRWLDNWTGIGQHPGVRSRWPRGMHSGRPIGDVRGRRLPRMSFFRERFAMEGDATPGVGGDQATTTRTVSPRCTRSLIPASTAGWWGHFGFAQRKDAALAAIKSHRPNGGESRDTSGPFTSNSSAASNVHRGCLDTWRTADWDRRRLGFSNSLPFPEPEARQP